MKDLDFAKRLVRACDACSAVPPFGQGQQTYLAAKLDLSQEAVRKWFTGESRPRPTKMKALAAILEVDEAWLSLGVELEASRREQKAFSRQTEAAVYLSLGLAMMEGGHCARPSDKDPRRDNIDFYLMTQGEQVAVRTSMAREVSPDTYEFFLPPEYSGVHNLGLIYKPGAKLTLLALSDSLVKKHRKTKNGGYTITVTYKTRQYTTGKDQWPQLAAVSDLAKHS